MQTIEPTPDSIHEAVSAEENGNGTTIDILASDAVRPTDGPLVEIVFGEEGLPFGSTRPTDGLTIQISGGKNPDELDNLHTIYLYGMALQAVTGWFRGFTQFTFLVPEGVDPRSAAHGLRLGLLQADHTASKRKSGPETLLLWNETGAEDDAFADAITMGDEDACYANIARLLTAMPVNYLGVLNYADVIELMFADQDGITVSEPDKADYAKMGLFGAVASASGFGPRIKLVRIDPIDGPTEDVDVEVGKALVNDTGGLSTKKDGGGPGMKCDMGGSASILGKARMLAKNRHLLKRSYLAAIAIAENAIGPKSYRVGDVLTSYSGKRVEVTNTDAEGRLVLADTIEYIFWHFNVFSMTVLATLTGAAMVGIGTWASALHLKGKSGPCDDFDVAEETSRRVGDPVHRLYEMGHFSVKAMASKIADIINANTKSKQGGSQTAFYFLCFFLPDGFVNFRFIDVAGKVDTECKGGIGLVVGTARPAATVFLIEEQRLAAAA